MPDNSTKTSDALTVLSYGTTRGKDVEARRKFLPVTKTEGR